MPKGESLHANIVNVLSKDAEGNFVDLLGVRKEFSL